MLRTLDSHQNMWEDGEPPCFLRIRMDHSRIEARGLGYTIKNFWLHFDVRRTVLYNPAIVLLYYTRDFLLHCLSRGFGGTSHSRV